MCLTLNHLLKAHKKSRQARGLDQVASPLSPRWVGGWVGGRGGGVDPVQAATVALEDSPNANQLLVCLPWPVTSLLRLVCHATQVFPSAVFIRLALASACVRACVCPAIRPQSHSIYTCELTHLDWRVSHGTR